MSENQASLAALSNRLAQSDNEVKRLQRELEISDASISDYRDLLSTMQNNVKHHQEQMQLISEQLKTKENLIDEIEENCRVEIQTIKVSLDKKIDTVMETTANEVSRLQEECTNKTKLNIEVNEKKKRIHYIHIFFEFHFVFFCPFYTYFLSYFFLLSFK